MFGGGARGNLGTKMLFGKRCLHILKWRQQEIGVPGVVYDAIDHRNHVIVPRMTGDRNDQVWLMRRSDIQYFCFVVPMQNIVAKLAAMPVVVF